MYKLKKYFILLNLFFLQVNLNTHALYFPWGENYEQPILADQKSEPKKSEDSGGWLYEAIKPASKDLNKLKSHLKDAVEKVGQNVTQHLSVKITDLEKEAKKDFVEIKDQVKDDLIYLKNDLNTDLINLKVSFEDAGQKIIDDVNLKAENLANNIDQKSKELTDTLNLKAQELVGNIDDRAKKLVLFSSIVAVMSYALIKSINLAFNAAEKPSIIIESSFDTLGQRIASFLGFNTYQLRPMIFSEQLQKRLDGIINAAKSTRRSIKLSKKDESKFSNVFLYGAPGTGKTMFAKELTKTAGLPFLLISGSSFAKFKEGEDIAEMDRLFNMAKNIPGGLALIIDEADSFLYGRAFNKPNEREYKLLNHFIALTGEFSDKIMIILCANVKNYMDPAMIRRIHQYIEMPLPQKLERVKVLNLYKDLVLIQPLIKNNQKQEIVKSIIENLDDKKIDEIASQTEGFSNADLENIIRGIKSDISDTDPLTADIIDEVFYHAMEKHKVFNGFNQKSLLP